MVRELYSKAMEQMAFLDSVHQGVQFSSGEIQTLSERPKGLSRRGKRAMIG